MWFLRVFFPFPHSTPENRRNDILHAWSMRMYSRVSAPRSSLTAQVLSTLPGIKEHVRWPQNGISHTKEKKKNPAKESYYGSPPNFFLTKSRVLIPAPGCISLNMVPLATPTSSFDSPLQTRKHVKLFSS